MVFRFVQNGFFQTTQELEYLFTTKATGPDLINPRLIREGASILKLPLCLLFNLTLSTCRFPTQWKLANVTPVFKKDNPSKVNNYTSFHYLAQDTKGPTI
jgi:hypothetical protein